MEKKEHYLIIKKKMQNKIVLDSCILKAIEICETGHQKSGFPSFYDASYHALAINNDCIFITADSKHISKTLQFGHIRVVA